ncbi:MAG: LTA synthase family protein [Clostridiales bacterium]|nr:LTA synthase family protein [Clostridiales bacterium]
MPIVERKKLSIPTIIIPLLLPVPVFIFETILAYLVYGSLNARSLGHMFLSSLYMTTVPVVILCLVTRRTRRILLPVFTAVYALPFLVERFIYMQFKTVYDLNTVVNGGEGALTGFSGTIKEMAFSPSGIRTLVVFIILIIAGTVFLITDKKYPVYDRRAVALVISIGVCAFLLNAVLIRTNDVDKRAYKEEYSFQTAVQRFGLLDSLRLDIQNVSKDNVEFSASSTGTNAIPTVTPKPTATPAPTVPGATPTPTPSPTPIPEPQVMDIDFEQIAEDESGTISTLAEYCSTLTPSNTNIYTGLFEGKNLIMITAEAFTEEVIDPDLTPTLYRLAYNGINFNDFYVPATAGTTGGEFTHLFGFLPTLGGSSVPHLTSHGDTYFTMGQQLNSLGYYGMAFHNNDYQFYTRNTTHNRLGYSEGFMGWGNGMEDYVDPVWPESDLQMFEGTVPLYIENQPFNVYYMTVSGHSNYSYSANAMARAHWDETAFMEDLVSEKVRAYISANLELEASMAYLVGQLEEYGIEDDTVICICADHFPYGLDQDAPPGNVPYLSELYGYDVTNYIERDHNRAIIWSGCLEDMDPIIVDSPASSMDILPTLLNLFGLEWDSRLFPGRDVLSDAPALYFDLNYDWKTDYGTYINSSGEFIPASDDIDIPDGYVDAIRDMVADKITYTRGALNNDFIAYLFPVEEE